LSGEQVTMHVLERPMRLMAATGTRPARRPGVRHCCTVPRTLGTGNSACSTTTPAAALDKTLEDDPRFVELGRTALTRE
jgi:hypothetical protein